MLPEFDWRSRRVREFGEQRSKGHRGHTLLTDHTSGKGISISLFETEADMTAGEGSGHYQQQIAKFKGLFAAPPVRETYEVSVQARAKKKDQP